MSLQLTQYLAARSDGAPVVIAADMAGFSLTEARLTETAVAKGELEMPRARARAREDQLTKEGNVAREDVKTSIRVNGGPEVPLDLEKGLDHPENAAAKEQMGHLVENALGNAATRTGEQIKRYIERVERLDTEIKDLNGDKSDLFKEMKSNGFELPIPLAGISIIVPGAPVPKGRPRVTTRGGFARAYTPAKTQRYEDLIRLEAGRVMEHHAQLDGQIRVLIRAYMPMPQALAKHKVKGPSAERGVIRPITKPDADNIAKVVDALNGIVWRDDSQVVSLTVDKFYSSRPRLELVAVEL